MCFVLFVFVFTDLKNQHTFQALLEVTKSIVTYSGGQSAVGRSTQEESFEAVLSFLCSTFL